MTHQHRYTGFSENGRVVRRCPGCNEEEPAAVAPAPEPEPAPEPVTSDETPEVVDAETPVQPDIESATLRRNRRRPRRTVG